MDIPQFRVDFLWLVLSCLKKQMKEGSMNIQCEQLFNSKYYNQIKMKLPIDPMLYSYPILASPSEEQPPTPTSKQDSSAIEFEQSEILKRLHYLQQKCVCLQMENDYLKQRVKQQDKVTIRIEVIEKKQQDNYRQDIQDCSIRPKQPKKRRALKELDRSFICPYIACARDYASSLALNLHMRVKHGGGTKRERKQLLKEIIAAELKGEELPQIKINLPPNYIEEKKQMILQCDQLYKPPSIRPNSE